MPHSRITVFHYYTLCSSLGGGRGQLGGSRMLQEVNSRLEGQHLRCRLQPDSPGRGRHPSGVKNHCLLHKSCLAQLCQYWSPTITSTGVPPSQGARMTHMSQSQPNAAPAESLPLSPRPCISTTCLKAKLITHHIK